MDYKERIFYLLCLGLLIFFNIKTTRTFNDKSGDILTDTVTLTDTLYADIPIPIIKYIDRIKYDTIPSVIHDTIRIKSKPKIDTISNNKFEYVYETNKYKATISGLNVSLDEMILYNQTKVVTIKPKLNRFSLGIYTGYGVCGNQSGFTLGIGISYTLFKF